MTEQNSPDESEEYRLLIASIAKYVERYYHESECEVSRIKHNVWTIQENEYVLNIIITSMLIIFDTELFSRLPDKKNPFFEELLRLNSHYVRSAKLCLVKDQTHMRILRGLEGFDYSEFETHVDEFREIYPEVIDKLSAKYYSFSPSQDR